MNLAKHVRDRCTESHGCLLWKMACNNGGTPVFRLKCCGSRNPRQILWTEAGFELKPGWVFATPPCDSRCVAPEHQSYITRRQSAKGATMSSGVKHSLAIRESARKKPHVILNLEKVAQIRLRYAEIGNAAQVAREFKIGHALAHRVCRNQLWRETTPFSL